MLDGLLRQLEAADGYWSRFAKDGPQKRTIAEAFLDVKHCDVAQVLPEDGAV
jgi:hypothetical protein